jgi:hypothetical protein
MQEHIRRAHPDHYIPKLPATEESFQAMINLIPSARPLPPTSNPSNNRYPNSSASPESIRNLAGLNSSHHNNHDIGQHHSAYGSPAPVRTLEEQYTPAATAAVALAQLHGSRQDQEWVSESVSYSYKAPQCKIIYSFRRLPRNLSLDGLVPIIHTICLPSEITFIKNRLILSLLLGLANCYHQ